MKNLMNPARILIGIFMAPLLSLAQSQDPALTQQPSTAMEALAPAGANAPTPEQSAGAVSVSPPVAQAPAPVVAPPVKLMSPNELADIRRAKANSFAFASLPEVSADANGDGLASENWLPDRSNNKSVAIFNYKGGQAMRFQQLALTSTTGAVVTVDMIEKKSTITVFEKKKPASYTIIRGDEHYTATPAFCKILREQTKSTSFDDLAAKAKTCNAFYDRSRMNYGDDQAVGAILATHTSNLQLMKKTIAKDFVPERMVATRVGNAVNWADRQNDAIINFIFPGKINSKPPVNADTWKARSILSKTSSKQEASDRQVIEEVARACSTLWTDADAEPTTGKVFAPAKAKKISQ